MTETTEKFLETLSTTPLNQRMDFVRKNEHILPDLNEQDLDRVGLELCRTASTELRRKYPIVGDNPQESPQELFERTAVEKNIQEAQADALQYAEEHSLEATHATRTEN